MVWHERDHMRTRMVCLQEPEATRTTRISKLPHPRTFRPPGKGGEGSCVCQQAKGFFQYLECSCILADSFVLQGRVKLLRKKNPQINQLQIRGRGGKGGRTTFVLVGKTSNAGSDARMRVRQLNEHFMCHETRLSQPLGLPGHGYFSLPAQQELKRCFGFIGAHTTPFPGRHERPCYHFYSRSASHVGSSRVPCAGWCAVAAMIRIGCQPVVG